MRREMFGLSDDSEGSSRGSIRSISHLYIASAKNDDVGHHDNADGASRSHRSRSNLSDCADRSASTYVVTTREEQRDALQSDLQNEP